MQEVVRPRMKAASQWIKFELSGESAICLISSIWFTELKALLISMAAMAKRRGGFGSLKPIETSVMIGRSAVTVE